MRIADNRIEGYWNVARAVAFAAIVPLALETPV